MPSSPLIFRSQSRRRLHPRAGRTHNDHGAPRVLAVIVQAWIVDILLTFATSHGPERRTLTFSQASQDKKGVCRLLSLHVPKGKYRYSTFLKLCAITHWRGFVPFSAGHENGACVGCVHLGTGGGVRRC
ncbi:hypothetical protein PENSPDRAFT_335483 [Peniophora sp. CONT]|nr:hypothetical protein PENSPDRAFT_335483 [Peniophora sp. CONT]